MKRITALFIVVLMTICMPLGAMKAYGDETSIEIVFEYDGIHAGSQALISVLVNGSKPTGDAVTWTVSGNQSEKTLVLTNSRTYPGGSTEVDYRLYAGLDETAEDILIRAELKDDPSVYDELAVQVLPPNYVSKVELSNAEDATKVYASETASEAISKFGESYTQVFPVPHEAIETRRACLIKVQEEYKGQKPSISKSQMVVYDGQISEGEEYYFMIIFDRNTYMNRTYYFDPDGIDITYNGKKVADYEVYDGSDPMYMSLQNSLLVYIKAEIDNDYFGDDGTVKILLSDTSVRAGSAASLKAEVNGEESTDVTWTIKGNNHPDTRIENMTFGSSGSALLLILSVYEDAEEIVLRATSNEYPSKYDEVLISVIPVEYIDRLVLSNAPDAVYVDSSMKVIDGIRSFTKDLKTEVPESGIMGMVGTGIYRVPNDYDGDVPDYTKFEYLDYDANLAEGSEYYFVLTYQISVLYYYDPSGFTVTYNGRNADHWAYGKNAGPDGFLKVYIKARFTDENDVSVVPIGINSSSFTVSGNIVTTDSNVPLAAGYYSEGSFVPLEATENSDGTHSFTVPEGVYELVLVLKGDVNQDGRLSNADSTKLKAAVKGMTELDPTQILASDVNNDGKLSNADSTKLKAVIKGMSGISW